MRMVVSSGRESDSLSPTKRLTDSLVEQVLHARVTEIVKELHASGQHAVSPFQPWGRRAGYGPEDFA